MLSSVISYWLYITTYDGLILATETIFGFLIKYVDLAGTRREPVT